VVVNSQKPEALTVVGKERATNKGNKNLRIKKEGFIPLSLDRLSINITLVLSP